MIRSNMMLIKLSNVSGSGQDWTQSGRQSYKWYRTWSVAAVAIVLLGLITVTAYWQGSRQIQSNFSDIVVEAPLGSKTKLTLPDGSTVWLNAGSKMVYSQGFGVSDRRLAFQGEGYFEVEKNDEMPFLVQTHDVNVTVVGTKFNFRNYPEDEEAVVELLEGRVALENQLKGEKSFDICRPMKRWYCIRRQVKWISHRQK